MQILLKKSLEFLLLTLAKELLKINYTSKMKTLFVTKNVKDSPILRRNISIY